MYWRPLYVCIYCHSPRELLCSPLLCTWKKALRHQIQPWFTCFGILDVFVRRRNRLFRRSVWVLLHLTGNEKSCIGDFFCHLMKLWYKFEVHRPNYFRLHLKFELNVGFYFLKYILSLEMFRAVLDAMEVKFFVISFLRGNYLYGNMTNCFSFVKVH